METVVAAKATQMGGCLALFRRGLKWFALVLGMLVIVGVVYQAVASEVAIKAYPPRGQLHNINGHLMHIYCAGEGSPAVVLEAGYYANSLWWYRVQQQLAPHTKVCAYDRPGHGWSEPTPGMGDANTIVAELHQLLQQAEVNGPYILAGHSAGGILSRIYAYQFPDEVGGVVLVDSAFLRPKHYTQEEWEAWKAENGLLQGLIWAMTRSGLMRIITPQDFRSYGYPPEIADELAVLRSANQTYDTDYSERYDGRLALNEASAAAEDLGDLPVAILWATEGLNLSASDLELLHEIHQEIDGYSSNSVSYDVEGSSHGSILGNEQYAQRVSNAILNVRQAAETGQPLQP